MTKLKVLFQNATRALTSQQKKAVIGTALCACVATGASGCATAPGTQSGCVHYFAGGVWIGKVCNPVKAAERSWTAAIEETNRRYNRPSYTGARHDCYPSRDARYPQGTYECYDKAVRKAFLLIPTSNGDYGWRPLP